MPYDVELAERIRFHVEGEPGLSERRMFGGLAFLVHGHLAFAASSAGGLLVRVDPAASQGLVTQDGVARMEMGGRPMDGWLRVAPDRLATEDDLERWVARGLGYVRTLPPKQPKSPGPPKLRRSN